MDLGCGVDLVSTIEYRWWAEVIDQVVEKHEMNKNKVTAAK